MNRLKPYRPSRPSGPAPADTLRSHALPYPNGWFCVAFSDELKPGAIITRPIMGEEVVVYRTERGTIRAVRPYCPHLGAHLGAEAGGKIEGEDIVCPFHRFAFDTTGACVRTGYGTPPPRASLITYPVREVNGTIYVWRHSLGAEPDWEVPVLPTAVRGRFSHQTLEMGGHPQSIIENAFDFGHLRQLHGLKDVTIEGSPVPGEPTCVLPVSASRPFIPKLSYTLTVIGLSTLAAESSLFGDRGHLCVLLHATPISPGRIHLRAGALVTLDGVEGPAGRLGRLLTSAAEKTLTRLLAFATVRDGFPDFPVWNYQEHLEHPRLVQGDGPIGRYRQWTRQFYTEPSTAAADETEPAGIARSLSHE